MAPGRRKLWIASTTISTSSALIMYLVTRSRPPCRLKLRMMNAATTVISRNTTLTVGLVIMGTKPSDAISPIANL